MTRHWLTVFAGLGAMLVSLAACGGGHDGSPARRSAAPLTGRVLFGLDFSTDPHPEAAGGASTGIGLVNRLGAGSEIVRLRGSRWAPADSHWLTPTTVTVGRTDGTPPGRFSVAGGRFHARPGRPVPGGKLAGAAWSPDGGTLAFQRRVGCPGNDCAYRPDRTIRLMNEASGHIRPLAYRGLLVGWHGNHDVIVMRDDGSSSLVPVNGGNARSLLMTADAAHAARAHGALLGPPATSSDGRYVAAGLWGRFQNRRTFSAVVIARPGGHIVRVLPTRLSLTLIAWAPTGHKLAYTAGGFPQPHVLVLLDNPGDPAKVRYRAGDRHFDWVTWAPDGSRLLLDDEHANRWRLIPADGGRVTSLPRLGGRPLWCCPEGESTP
jgi:hypothetical protein